MLRLIDITAAANKKVFVNPQYIMALEPIEDDENFKTLIVLIDDRMIDAMETVKEICKKIGSID